MTEIMTENSVGAAFAVPNINTQEHLREAVKTVIRDWVAAVGVKEPRIKTIYAHFYNPETQEHQAHVVQQGHDSLEQFMDKMKAAREVQAFRGQYTGTAMTKDGTQSWIGEVPPLLMTMMQREFGGGWIAVDSDIWKIFKDEFRIGSLTPQKKDGKRGTW